MDRDEKQAKDFLEKRDFYIKSYTKEEKAKKKTPDFRVYRGENLIFFCEVKTIDRDTWLEDLLIKAPPLTIVGGGRNDPRFNRVSNKIHEAALQFDSVNPDLTYPNVLIFVIHDDSCDFHTLINVITGYFIAEGGELHLIYGKFSHGRIRKEKSRINLYIWMDENREDPGYFIIKDKNHHNRLCDLFDLDTSKIKYYR